MFSNDSRSGLLGRQSECDVLDRLLNEVRATQSRVLVLRGEAGVGKSSLLDYVADKGSDCRVVRAAGAESETALAFASLHQLCSPMLDQLEQLPGPQRNALGTAFGLTMGDAPDRFLVGLGVLSLLSYAAEGRPLVCLVDDAQWLDRVSAQVLAFVARRLLAESVALVFALREPSDVVELEGLPQRTIRGLSESDAGALLDSASHGRLDERVRERIVEETRGNPLALLELPRAMTAAELAGGFALPAARPLSSQIEQSFVRRIQSLPTDTRTLLLAAAAEPVGDRVLLRRAADRLGIRVGAEEPAEADGLIEFGARVRFRHPLVRSAAYRSGSYGDRQEVHRALAAVTDPELDPDRRAWHSAHATAQPDEEVAADLVRSAERARSRGGVAAAAAFLDRAAQLTPDPVAQAMRALLAAQAKFEAADPDAADELLAAVEMGPMDESQRALVSLLRAQIAFARRRGSDAPSLLLNAAERIEPFDHRLARETYLEALGAATVAGRLSGVATRTVAEAARSAQSPLHPPMPIDHILDAVATLLTEGHEPGIAALQRALPPFMSEVLLGREQTVRWLGLSCPLAQELACHQMWDFDAWNELASRAVTLARETGALAHLSVELMYLAGVRLHEGDFDGASVMIDEADAITSATGYAPVRYAAMVLVAWRGDETRALRLMAADVDDAVRRGEGVVYALAGYVAAVLNNGLGNYAAAFEGAQQACTGDDLSFVGWSLAELIEAGARSDAHDEAADALSQLETRTRAAGTDWALGMLARSRALLSAGSEAEALYREAIERLDRSRIVVHLARAHLLYGEWLRRANRRSEARDQLRIAYDMLHRMGAGAFAERARRELLATGETIRVPAAAGGGTLTPQETQIARLAADGQTNLEIGGELFISPRTVEYHLSKVFLKLGITSRTQLKMALADPFAHTDRDVLRRSI